MAQEVKQKVEVQEKSLWGDLGEHIELPNEGSTNEEHRGVIYLGRIPYGFFEEQMLEYFSQFGEVTRLKLSRNKKVLWIILDHNMITHILLCFLDW